MDYCTGLENRRSVKGSLGSNPSLPDYKYKSLFPDEDLEMATQHAMERLGLKGKRARRVITESRFNTEYEFQSAQLRVVG